LIFKSIKIIIEISNVISDIRGSLNDPAISRNIENIAQNIQYMQNAAKSIQNAITILEDTGVFREARDFIAYGKKTVNSEVNPQNLKGITNTIRVLSLSVRDLLRELKSYMESHSAKCTTSQIP
jgi:DNA repair ATPase RecN